MRRFAGFCTAVLVLLAGPGLAPAASTPSARVRTCMAGHLLDYPHAIIHTSTTVTLFASCDWPPPSYADPTGYSLITVATVAGPGSTNASGEDYADRINSTCSAVELAYKYGSPGAYFPQPAFEAKPGAILIGPGQAWKGKPRQLPFSRSPGEVVYLHNANYVLESAACVG
jgi:hypothetical protein